MLHLYKALLSFVFLSTSAAPALAQTNVPDLNVDKFTEKEDEIQPISGTGLKGLIYFDDLDNVSLDNLFIKVPSDYQSPISISLTTPDGNYEANWSVTASGLPAGWARLPYKGSKKHAVVPYKVSHLGLLATDKAGNILPMRWSDPTDTEMIFLLINSEGKDSYTVTRKNGRASKNSCQPISGLPTINIDKVCALNPATTLKRDGMIEISRKEGLSVLTPIRVDFTD